MATAMQVTALIRAFHENDRDRFITTALQLAAHEARNGHGAVAHEIQRLVTDLKDQPKAKLHSFTTPETSLLDDLSIISKPEERIGELVATAHLKEQLKRFLLEYRERAKILAHGLSPRRKALFAGVPGTGKTMTARVVAGELQLPLYTILMDKLVTKFLGESSAKIRQVFTIMEHKRGVYFFDEFDAIAGDRSRENDVGEMRRVLNTFLQLMEQDTSDSIILAATNEANILDTALFRRFDDILYYTLPDNNAIEELLINRLAGYWEKTPCIHQLVRAAIGLNHAEITQACNDAIKYAILNDKNIVENLWIQEAIAARKSKYSR